MEILRLLARIDEVDHRYERNRQLAQRRRRLRQESDAFEMPDSEFVATYRLSKGLVRGLCHDLEPLMPARRRTTAIPIDLKILSTLAFYANGSYQRGVGQNYLHGLSQPSVSNALHDVTAALNSPGFMNQYIRFPQTAEERLTVVRGFTDKFGVPGVLGCVDGTHVALIRPRENEERFYNRKGYHSRNVQIVCDSNLNILDVDASFGGASHDSYIWRYSEVHGVMEQLYEDGESVWLLGDAGYPLRPWLMSPIVNAPPGSPEMYYYNTHCRVRNTVERCIGVLKARWRCLLAHRTLHYDHITVGRIINACCVLHNIAHAAGLPVPAIPQEDVDRDRELQEDPNFRLARRNIRLLYRTGLERGVATREQLVRRLWIARHRWVLILYKYN